MSLTPYPGHMLGMTLNFKHQKNPTLGEHHSRIFCPSNILQISLGTFSGSVVTVVVTAYDFESSRPDLNPEWGPIYYMALITAKGYT